MRTTMQHNKRFLGTIATLLTMGIALLCSCSNIDEDERLVYVAPKEAKRAILIEDFTGQKCPNCPNGTKAIHEMQETYGEENVIAVAIHCGPFGLASGLVTDLGKTYWNHWFTETQGQPVIKVNRGSSLDDIMAWTNEVTKELSKSTDVTLNMTTAYDDASRNVTIDVECLGKAGNIQKLQLWLIEDGIVALQKQPDGSNMINYVHDHVLREAVNGEWGEEITFKETPITVQHTFTLKEKYMAKNCSLVAFTYDSNGVSQAIIKKIFK